MFLIFNVIIFLFSSCIGLLAFAETDPIGAIDFIIQIMKSLKDFGGMSAMVKTSIIITLIISSLKVSFLNNLIWSKLGGCKVFIAPLLGLIGGLVTLKSQAVSAADITVYLISGGGAVFLHELLDSIKEIPGIGPVYLTIINILTTLLRGPQKSDINDKVIGR
jgi:cytochrome c oxidase subunit IV